MTLAVDQMAPRLMPEWDELLIASAPEPQLLSPSACTSFIPASCHGTLLGFSCQYAQLGDHV